MPLESPINAPIMPEPEPPIIPPLMSGGSASKRVRLPGRSYQNVPVSFGRHMFPFIGDSPSAHACIMDIDA